MQDVNKPHRGSLRPALCSPGEEPRGALTDAGGMGTGPGSGVGPRAPRGLWGREEEWQQQGSASGRARRGQVCEQPAPGMWFPEHTAVRPRPGVPSFHGAQGVPTGSGTTGGVATAAHGCHGTVLIVTRTWEQPRHPSAGDGQTDWPSRRCSTDRNEPPATKTHGGA